MIDNSVPGSSRAAMVILRPDGRWEVQVSEAENSDGLRRWSHKKMFRTEQEAEIYARSILPYSHVAWDQRFDMWQNEREGAVRVKLPEKNRKPMHKPED